MRKITKRSTAIAAAVAIATGGAGAAWATWTLSASGTTSAKAATVIPLEIGGAQVEGLSPGASGDIQFVVTNKNKFPVRVTNVTITSIVGPDTCKAPENVDKQSFQTPGNLNVGAAGSSPAQATLTIPNAIRMKTNAGNDCQGAVFTVSLTAQAETTAS